MSSVRKSAGRNHEKGLTNLFIGLTFLLLFFGASSDFSIFKGISPTSEGLSDFTGMATSQDKGHNDSYPAYVAFGKPLGQSFREIGAGELAGLIGGSVSTSLGTSVYNQYIKFSSIFASGETLDVQPSVLYGLSSNFLGDYFFMESKTGENVKAENAFMEFGAEFASGLSSNLSLGVLKDLKGSSFYIISDEYDIIDANVTGGAITLTLLDYIIQDNLIQGQEKFYLIEKDGVTTDYNLEAGNIPNLVPEQVDLDITGYNFDDVSGTYNIGDTITLSDGTPVSVTDISLNEAGYSGYADGPLNTSMFGAAYGITGNATGDTIYFIADSGNDRIRMVNLESGNTTLVAGNAHAGSDDGEGSNAKFNNPRGIASYYDSSSEVNSLFVADTGNDRIRKIELTWDADSLSYSGDVTTIAGSGWGTTSTTASSGIHGADAKFKYPEGITVDATGNIFVVDTGNHRILKIFSNGESNAEEADNWNVTIVAGTGSLGLSDGVGDTASFSGPRDLDISNDGTTIYVSDSRNNAIRNITKNDHYLNWNETESLNWNVSTVAGGVGTGAGGYNNGEGDVALFNTPIGITYSGPSSKFLFVADSGNDRIRKIDLATNTVYSPVGSGVSGYVDGLLESARLNNPSDVFVNSDNTRLYFLDTNNYKVRYRYVDNNVHYVATLTGNATTVGNNVDLYLGGDLIVLTDSDYTDDETANNLGYTQNFRLNGELIDNAFVQIQANDTDPEDFTIDSIKYRLVASVSSGGNFEMNESISLSSLLTEPLGMIGTFDIFYLGDVLPPIEKEIKLNYVNVSLNDTYEITFENMDGRVISFPYMRNNAGARGYGDVDGDLVFVEGKIDKNISTATAGSHDFTVGLGDYFVLSNADTPDGIDNNAVTEVIQYVSYDVASKKLNFVNLYDGSSLGVTYVDTVGLNGTVGSATLSVNNRNYGIYLANTTTADAMPLAIDMNGDGNFETSQVYVTDKSGAVLDLGIPSEGGTWDPSGVLSGTWGETGIVVGSGSVLSLISNYEEFGFDSNVQGLTDVCNAPEGTICTAVVLTENAAYITLTNTGSYLANARMQLDGCTTDHITEGFVPTSTRTFNFKDCTGQNDVGIKVQKNFALLHDTGTTPNIITESEPGNLTYEVTGGSAPCVYEVTDIPVTISGTQLDISEIAAGTVSCWAELNVPEGTNNYGMNSHGAFFNETGEELKITYPDTPRQAIIQFVTDYATGTGSCTPTCPDPSTIACGTSIYPTNGCGTCSGTGTQCSSGETCNPTALTCEACTPLTQSQVCSGYDCGSVSDGCGGSIACGSCGSDQNCNGNLCENNPITCTDNANCTSGYICSAGICVDGGSSGLNFETFEWDIDDFPTEFEMVEEDWIIVTGLDDDYAFELNRVYTSGKIRFGQNDTGMNYYINEAGDTVNIDADDDGTYDFNIKSVEVNTLNDEATVEIEAGEYVSSSNTSSSGSSSYCGDGTCEAGETTFTCPLDCLTTASYTTPTTTPTVYPGTTTPSSSTGGYQGGSTVTQESDNLLLWIALGILLMIIVILAFIMFLRPRGSPTKGYSVQGQQSEPVATKAQESEYKW
ncbi:hypothetical protein HN992_02240 [Candidatus Woesearchaeota archaeon]|nr:hypothetical protein [Candidatus Woesearchaeota archaeon]